MSDPTAANARPHGQRSEGTQRTTCSGCRYYYITYDPGFPYGCQLLGFKSKRAPVTEVYRATQSSCQGYEPRR